MFFWVYCLASLNLTFHGLIFFLLITKPVNLPITTPQVWFLSVFSPMGTVPARYSHSFPSFPQSSCTIASENIHCLWQIPHFPKAHKPSPTRQSSLPLQSSPTWGLSKHHLSVATAAVLVAPLYLLGICISSCFRFWCLSFFLLRINVPKLPFSITKRISQQHLPNRELFNNHSINEQYFCVVTICMYAFWFSMSL